MTGRITTYAHDGLVFDVRDTGPLDGTPAVLLHGFPERNTSWDAVAPLLHERGIRTLAPDQRGYSPGARPPRRRDYRLSHLAGDVEALAAEVGGPVHLVGHDWGAVVGWAVAARSPELVRSLTAVSVPHPTAFLRAMATSSQGPRSWYAGLFQLPRVPELLARHVPAAFDRGLRRSGMTAEQIARFHREMIDDGALPGALGWYRAAPLVDRGLAGLRVTVPTTLVWSDRDTAVARRGAELTAGYVDAPYAFEVLEGVTHWIPVQAPEQLAEIAARRIAAADAGTGAR